MTTLNDVFAGTRNAPPARPATADVFGVAWPLYKLHAVLAGLLAVAAVLAAGGSGVTAMWISAAAVLVVWWGERIALTPRWDHGRRDHDAHS